MIFPLCEKANESTEVGEEKGPLVPPREQALQDGVAAVAIAEPLPGLRQRRLRLYFGACCLDVRTFNFLPTNGFSIEPLKAKLLAGEEKATEYSPALACWF